MMSERSCACKGVRSCLHCEHKTRVVSDGVISLQDVQQQIGDSFQKTCWYYCLDCPGKAFISRNHFDHLTSDTPFQELKGISVYPDFISKEDEEFIISQMDGCDWVQSQSGRRKQDFGPKVNFKRKKIKLDAFRGFPSYADIFLRRMRALPELSDFQPVEMCNLDYDPDHGAAIDPHFDDFWLWGERLVTVNLLSDTFYAFTHPDNDHIIKVQLKRRCLAVLSGDARYKWMHAIARQDITTRRVGINIRELTPEFLPGGQGEVTGQQLLDIAVINPTL